MPGRSATWSRIAWRHVRCSLACATAAYNVAMSEWPPRCMIVSRGGRRSVPALAFAQAQPMLRTFDYRDTAKKSPPPPSPKRKRTSGRWRWRSSTRTAISSTSSGWTTAAGQHRRRHRQGAFGGALQAADEGVSGRVAAGGEGLRMLALEGAVPVEGGVPLVVGGKIVGAIGASGGTSAQDGVGRRRRRRGAEVAAPQDRRGRLDAIDAGHCFVQSHGSATGPPASLSTAAFDPIGWLSRTNV